MYQAKTIKITQELVNEVYQKILDAGKNPVITTVQDELQILTNKRGSNDDIARMLRIAKGDMENTEKPKTLTQRIQTLESEAKELRKVAEIVEGLLQEVAELKKKVKTLEIKADEALEQAEDALSQLALRELENQ